MAGPLVGSGGMPTKPPTVLPPSRNPIVFGVLYFLPQVLSVFCLPMPMISLWFLGVFFFIILVLFIKKKILTIYNMNLMLILLVILILTIYIYSDFNDM
jgi:hypothetical protein